MALRLFRGSRSTGDTDTPQQLCPQYQSVTVISDEEQQQPVAFLESPPPSYDEVMKETERSDIRI